MTGRQVTFHAYGHPVTQGSKTRTRWGMRDDNGERLKPWRDTVTAAAIDAMGDDEPITGPVRVAATFLFNRPASHYGTGRNAGKLKLNAPAYPSNRGSGDVDKLLRAVLDSLTVARVFVDDCQVVDAGPCKVFTASREGAYVIVQEMGS